MASRPVSYADNSANLVAYTMARSAELLHFRISFLYIKAAGIGLPYAGVSICRGGGALLAGMSVGGIDSEGWSRVTDLAALSDCNMSTVLLCRKGCMYTSEES